MLFAIIFSILAGVCIVLARTTNALLSKHCSLLISTFYNFLFGLIFSIVVLFILGKNEISFFKLSYDIEWYKFLGGILGVVVVFISALVAPKISSLIMTLLMFLGQVFFGVIIDWLLTGVLNISNINGGLVVFLGLVFITLDKKKSQA